MKRGKNAFFRMKKRKKSVNCIQQHYARVKSLDFGNFHKEKIKRMKKTINENEEQDYQ